MADFLSSEYCIFTPTRIRKYNCCYSSGHVTIYLKDGKVISASGSLPGGMNLQDAYQPENCTETQMGGGGNAPVHYRKANIPPQTTEFPSQNYDNVQEDKINIFPELIFLILYISFFIFIIGLLIYAAILSRQTKKVIKDAKELLKNKNSIKTNEYNSITEEYDYDNKFEYIKQEKKINIFTIKIILLIIILASIIYFHPTEEVLTCLDGNCKVKQTYFGIFNVHKEIKTNYNSRLSCSYGMYSAGKRHSNYGLYIRIDGKAPFVFYVDNSNYGSYSYQMEDLEKSCNKQVQKFNEYKNYPELYQYTIKSKASVFNLIISIVFTLLFIIIMFSDDKRQYNKNRKKYY